jgi:hypothetical protein
VHAVCDPVRELDADLLEAGGLESGRLITQFEITTSTEFAGIDLSRQRSSIAGILRAKPR